MSTFLHMVVKHEADRYLDSVLAAVAPQVDGIHVCNDHSWDESEKTIVEAYGGTYSTPWPSVPGFLENEGAFRQSAWNRMIDCLDLRLGDWVITLDADEFLVGDLAAATKAAEDHGYSTLRLPIAEVFLLDPPSRRIDGFWGRIDGFRATRYQAGTQVFKDGMACGTLPVYADRAWSPNDIEILHVGYAKLADRQAKYERYSSHANNGHASSHIRSILATPQLVLLEGAVPPIWRGRKGEAA